MNSFNTALFESKPVIAIVRNLTLAQIETFMPYFTEAGFTTIEVTMNTPQKKEIIAFLLKNYPQLNIGAGTICSIQDAEWAIKQGCSFLVTPVMNPEVITNAITNNTVIFPGAFTPSEIYKAHTMGAYAVKVFPANTLGPDYIKQILGPLDDLKLVPTGGINKSNMQLYLEAGALGLGIGGALFNTNLLKLTPKEIRSHFQEIANML